MEVGQTVVCMGDTFRVGNHAYKIPDLDRGQAYTITEVHVKKCGCGGDRIALEGVEGLHCTKKFLLGTEIVEIYNNLKGKLSVIDFQALEERLN